MVFEPPQQRGGGLLYYKAGMGGVCQGYTLDGHTPLLNFVVQRTHTLTRLILTNAHLLARQSDCYSFVTCNPISAGRSIQMLYNIKQFLQRGQ